MRNISKIIVSVSILMILVKSLHCKKYHNYTLYRSMPVLQKHLDFFQNIHRTFQVSFWKQPGKLYRPIDFIISPNEKEKILKHARRKNIKIAPLLKNIQSLFDDEKASYVSYIKKNTETFNWKSYARLDDIYNWMSDLTQLYPNDISMFQIATTYEKRPLIAARINLGGMQNKPKVIVDGGIHAREWIAPAVVTFLISEILNSINSNENNWKEIAEKYEWNIIPVLNPDGYEFTHEKDRLWRKNRRPTGKRPKNVGVDLNRNFGVAFATVGVSRDPTEDTYCGPHAFSEIETKALADFASNLGNTTEYYLSFHSYGQLIIVPYAYTKTLPEDYDDKMRLCSLVTKAIAKNRMTEYICGSAYNTVGYLASGVSADWMKRNLNIPHVISFELNDIDTYGFALPPSEIVPVSKEVINGLKVLLQPPYPG